MSQISKDSNGDSGLKNSWYSNAATGGSRSLLWLAILAIFFQDASVDAQPGMGPAPVVVARVVSTRQPSSQTFVGTLVPIRKSTVGSAVDGRVTGIFVDEGDPVLMKADGGENGKEIGQPLVQLRTVSLDIEIEAAEVELRTRQQAETELSKSLPADIDAALAVVEEIKARLKYAKADYDRLRKLSETGGGLARRELDEAFSSFRSQSQLLVAAEARLKKLQVTRESRLAQSRSKVEAQQAEIRRLKELRDKYTIRAPFSGYVTSKKTELGQWVSRGEDVLEIIKLDPIELVVKVPQSYIGQLQKSLDQSRAESTKFVARVSVDSVSQLLEGEVVQIVPQADLRSRSFPVKIRIRNPKTEFGHLLKSGMLGKASLFIGRDDDILLVKKDALVLGGPQVMVYVVSETPSPDGKSGLAARPVAVELGASIDDWIQVKGAIAEGDQVVVEGNERLRPMQPVVVARETKDALPNASKDPKTSPEAAAIN